MHFGNKAIAALGAGFALAAVVGCGGGNGLLTSNQAANLGSQLNAASSALSGHQCRAAKASLQSAADAVNNLGSVDQNLVSNLQQGVRTTQQLAQRDCPVRTQTQSTPTTTSTATTTSTPTTTTQTNTTSTTTTSTTPTQTNTTSTTTTSTTPTTTSTATTTTTPPPSGGSGLPSSSHLLPGRGQGSGFVIGREHRRAWWAQ